MQMEMFIQYCVKEKSFLAMRNAYYKSIYMEISKHLRIFVFNILPAQATCIFLHLKET